MIPSPVNERTLGIHQVELMVQPKNNHSLQISGVQRKKPVGVPGPSLGNGGGVGEHADGALHLGKVAARDDSGWLVVDANLIQEGRFREASH